MERVSQSFLPDVTLRGTWYGKIQSRDLWKTVLIGHVTRELHCEWLAACNLTVILLTPYRFILPSYKARDVSVGARVNAARSSWLANSPKQSLTEFGWLLWGTCYILRLQSSISTRPKTNLSSDLGAGANHSCEL